MQLLRANPGFSDLRGVDTVMLPGEVWEAGEAHAGILMRSLVKAAFGDVCFACCREGGSAQVRNG